MIRQEALNMETHPHNGINYKKDPNKKDWECECDSADEYNKQTTNLELESSYTTSDEHTRSMVSCLKSARNHLTGSFVKEIEDSLDDNTSQMKRQYGADDQF